jgi:ABC-type branched-subunit amino acid transport system substrate-binding protein
MRLNKSSILMLLAIGLICIAVVSSLAACGGTEQTTTTAASGTTVSQTTGTTTGSETTVTTVGTGETKELKIGTVAPLQLQQGIEIQKWMALFTENVNEQGGWKIGNDTYTLKSIVYDGGMNDPAKSRAAAERLVLQDGVKIMLSNWGDISEQTCAVTEPNKVLNLGCDFTDTTVTPEYNYFIRASGVYFARGLSYTVVKDMLTRGQKVELSVGLDDEQGKVGNMMWGKAAEFAGMTVLPGLVYPKDTTDFSSLATKIMSLEPRPDHIDLSFVTGDTITQIVSALYDAGYKGTVAPYNLNPNILANIIAKTGKEYIEGWEFLNFDPRGVTDDPKIVALIDKYTKKYGEFRSEGAFWVAPWFFFEDAVLNTQSVDVEVLREYLQSSKHGVRTLDGYSQLFARPDLENLKTVDVAAGHGVGIIRDGKMELLKTVSVQDQYLASIKVYGLVDVYKDYWAKNGKPTLPNEPFVFDWADLDK